MARTVPDLCLMLSAMMSEDSRDPLSAVVPGGLLRDPAGFAVPPPVDLARLRVATTPDFGFAPTERVIAETLESKLALLGQPFLSMEPAHPDCSGADEAFEVLRAVLFLGRHRELQAQHPGMIGPNVAANIEEGLRYSAADVARALGLQTQLYRRWQSFFQGHDILLSPAVTISPRPWRELYPTEIDGRPTRTYFHWLALAYAVTLAGHPAVSLPVGLDANGLPFGLQIVGPRGGDALVLGVAAALEQMLAGDPRTARPVPDLDRLYDAPPIAEMAGFRDFD